MPAFRRRSLLLLPLLVLLAGSALAGDVAVRFERAEATRWGESVYLVGDLPALGGGDPTRARRMVPAAGGRWRLDVALPEGAAYRYAYLVRDNAPARLGDPANVRWATSVLHGAAPGAPERRRVTLRYLSGFARVLLRYDARPGEEREAALRRVGPGRGPGEWVWEGTVETSLPELALVLHDGAGRFDAAPHGVAYRTGYARFTLADGQVHPGLSASGDLPAAREGRVVRVAGWTSRLLGNARDVFVYLPRGYGRDPARRYPVVYAQDGQNLFTTAAPWGGWRARETLDRLIGTGRIEEVIVVGVANTAARLREYVPEEDGGHAGRYARFLIEELKPWVDAHLQTLPGPEHTAILGSSLGGLVSVHTAWEHPHVFGRAASLSGSFWLRRWVEQDLVFGPRRGLRLWLDSGTAGASADSLEHTLAVRDALLRQGYVLGGDLEHAVDLGAGHDERAWAARLDEVLEFLFPAGAVSGR